jgi:hypothetical protein
MLHKQQNNDKIMSKIHPSSRMRDYGGPAKSKERRLHCASELHRKQYAGAPVRRCAGVPVCRSPGPDRNYRNVGVVSIGKMLLGKC